MAVLKGLPIKAPVRKENKMPDSSELFGPGGPGDPGGGPGFEDNSDCKAAIAVTGGTLEVVAPSEIFGGTYTSNAAEGVKIVSYDGTTGGVFVENSTYSVDGATISLSGRGKGLAGRCTALGVKDRGVLTVKNAVVYTNGKAKSCTSAEENSVLRVYDSILISMGQPYGAGVPAVEGPAASPPPALEIEGNSRTHCTMSNSSSYFTRCKIITDGWAALSTDAAMGYVYLQADDCQVISTKSGYAVYADGGCHDVINRCKIDAACMGAILGGESDVVFRDSQLVCGTYGALMHSVNGKDTEVGTLTFSNCTVKTKQELVRVKSDNTMIHVRSSSVETGNGVLVRTMVNDDPIATKVGPEPVYGVRIHFEDTAANGDLLHNDPEREMWVSMAGSVLQGAIQNAMLSMDLGSKWVATGDSQVVLVSDIDEAQLDAVSGVTITAKGGAPLERTLPSGGKLVVLC